MNEEKVQHIFHLLSIIHLASTDPNLAWVGVEARKHLDDLHPSRQELDAAEGEDEEEE